MSIWTRIRRLKKSSSDFAESTNNDLLHDICKSKQQLILLNVFTKSYIVCNLIQLGYHRRREIRENESVHRPVGTNGDSGDSSPLIFDRCINPIPRGGGRSDYSHYICLSPLDLKIFRLAWIQDIVLEYIVACGT